LKIASFVVEGRPAFGVVAGGGVVTVSGRAGVAFPTLREVLAAGALNALRDASANRGPDRDLDHLEYLPVIPRPDKILCVGVNYRTHADETGRELPAQPSIFARLQNTLIGHKAAMTRPRVSTKFDFEGELAVIIGKQGRHIPENQALDYVAGYSCFNDGSVRDYQLKHSLTVGKNFPATGPLGPWLTSADEIPDPSKLVLSTRLNGVQMQHAGTDQLIFTVPQIVAYVSRFTRLEPGDVISTGTPAGVGHRRDPQVFMRPGDVIEVEISGIGVLSNHVVDE
jgi:2-keto-4-pentenoate hydratase/2-oxohepta-3-ene-1,7-dioic acid hydratase in catechol pathway